MYRLRPTGPPDDGLCAAIFADVRGSELGGWPPAQAAAFLAQQRRARDLGYAAQFPGHRDEIIEVAGVPVGRLLTATDAGVLRVIDISLLTTARGEGIGTAVLRDLMAGHEAVALRVARGNPAAEWYRRLGFIPDPDAAEDEVYVAMRWTAGGWAR